MGPFEDQANIHYINQEINPPTNLTKIEPSNQSKRANDMFLCL